MMASPLGRPVVVRLGVLGGVLEIAPEAGHRDVQLGGEILAWMLEPDVVRRECECEADPPDDAWEQVDGRHAQPTGGVALDDGTPLAVP
jgi:hypothetical protein